MFLLALPSTFATTMAPLHLLILVCLLACSSTFESKLLQRPAFFNARHSILATPGFTSSSPRGTGRSSRHVQLHMALTPVGPFCPFRSKAAVAMESRMEHLSGITPEVAAEMGRVQMDFSSGGMPDLDQLLKVAEGLERETQNWQELMARLKLSGDFQTREYSKLTQAHLGRYNSTVESVSETVQWQAACLRAMATNQPPPFPPPSVNLTAIAEFMERQEQSSESLESLAKQPGSLPAPTPPGPILSAMASVAKIQETPFDVNCKAFESPTVRDEYEKLCRDHAQLIELGSTYSSFDPLGKIAFLDEIEKIQDRWDVFFARFQLLGVLNRRYVEQCDAFLASMSMDEAQLRDLLKRSHDLMRKEAEEERNLAYL